MDDARVEELFQHAADLDGDARRLYLEDACAGDEQLRARVERLLRELDRDDDFLEQPTVAIESIAAEAPDPVQIGRYQVEGVLGTGGHGRVYAAVQDTPHRRVAIKMLRAGALSEDRQARFAMEIELLGRLDHPGICQVHDAGVAEIVYPNDVKLQAAFCAMELVDGLALTRYCDEHDSSLRERIGLIAAVADAVHHAHQRGVIHRDLKPQNVLVTEPVSETGETGGGLAGRPKVLDFGVARLSDEADRATDAMTLPGTVIGTLGYMSPEQFGEGDIDVRCDVWALGVMAWELVAGKLPIDVSALPLFEVARVVREEEPGLLRWRDQKLDRDLEIVLRHALQKQPDRRYGSAAEFAADLRRWLQRQPIAARAPSFGYQLTMLARRHRGLFAGISLAAVALVVATVVSITWYFTADNALGRAVDSRDVAQEVSRFLRQDLLRQADPSRTLGHEPTVRELLVRASERIEGRFPDRPAVEADLRITLARTWSGLGDGKAALHHARRARELIDELGPEHHVERLDAMSALGEALHVAGEETESLQVRRDAWQLAQTALSVDDPNRYHLAVEYADQLTMEGQLADAEKLLREIVPVARRNLGEEDAATLKARNNFGLALSNRGKYEEAIAEYREVIAIRRRTITARHPDTMTTEANLAQSLLESNNLGEARSICTDVLTRRREVLGDEHWQTLMSWNNLSLIQSWERDYEGAAKTASEALAVTERVRGKDHRDTLRLKGNLVAYLCSCGRAKEALVLAREAMAGAERTMPKGHWVLGWHHVAVARALGRMGDFVAAEQELDIAYGLIEAALGPKHRQARTTVEMGLAVTPRLGDPALLERWQRRDEAGRLGPPADRGAGR